MKDNNDSDHTENEDNDNFNNDINKDFLNNISEELQAEMRMLQSYNNIGKMVGSFYMGLVESIGVDSIDLIVEFTETFISNYVYNLFDSFGGERK